MHRDFWAVLRWQRRSLKKVLNEADIEADDGSLKPRASATTTSNGTAAASCPVGGDGSGGKCPVMP